VQQGEEIDGRHRSSQGRTCMVWWQRQCLKWCNCKPENWEDQVLSMKLKGVKKEFSFSFQMEHCSDNSLNSNFTSRIMRRYIFVILRYSFCAPREISHPWWIISEREKRKEEATCSAIKKLNFSVFCLRLVTWRDNGNGFPLVFNPQGLGSFI
jgi:hypothetical protein